MSLRAVFLDVGNTLVHEVPSRFAIYSRAAAQRGASVTEEEMRSLMRRANDELPREIDGAFRYSDPWFEVYIERIFGDYLELPRSELAGITAELFASFEDAATFRLFRGALELLDGLRSRGLSVAVISNWSARLPRVLEATEMASHVDAVVCSAIERLEKPDPGIFELALERVGAAPAEALHAGDHPVKDVEGARNVGIEGVLVDHAGTAPDIDAPRATSLPELLRLVEERCA